LNFIDPDEGDDGVGGDDDDDEPELNCRNGRFIFLKEKNLKNEDQPEKDAIQSRKTARAAIRNAWQSTENESQSSSRVQKRASNSHS
jgi:hypothetical protein